MNVSGQSEPASAQRLTIAMVGTRGVPAHYGGFETAVEEVGQRLVARGHDVIVYCRGERIHEEYLGMRLVHLPALTFKATETLSHTALTTLHLLRYPADVVLVFNAANALMLPVIRIPTALHVDGLEWRRAKWGPVGRRYYLLSERLGVRWADELIADARGIQAYYRDTYGSDSRFIPYGAPILDDPSDDKLADLGLAPGAFHLVVARMEPENNVELMVRGYVASRARLPLVVVGSAPYAADYVRRIQQLGTDPRVRLVGSVWDQKLLNQLYRHCASYLHGHSVGGTNPSLLRAMGAGAPVSAVDVSFNREVLGDAGSFFFDAADVSDLIHAVESDPHGARARGCRGRERAAAAYRWEDVALAYEALCLDLHRARRTRRFWTTARWQVSGLGHARFGQRPERSAAAQGSDGRSAVSAPLAIR
jgi:glycosyltransferase involved in cell wall biosynthesis